MSGTKQKKRPRIARMSMKTRRSISGYLFIMPFIIGFLFFMVSPLFMSLQMSFSAVNSSTVGTDNIIVPYFGYGEEVKISKEIELPEDLRYDPEKYYEKDPEKHAYIVEPVDEVFTLRSDFAYGPKVALSSQIELPSYVWYNPVDLKEGQYNVEPLKTVADLGTSFSMGTAVALSEKIELPAEYQYNQLEAQKGNHTVELAASILELDSSFSFGKQIQVSNAKFDLPEGYHFLPEDETIWILSKENGFVFGTSVSLSEKIELPEGYRYCTPDEAAWIIAQKEGFLFEKAVIIPEKIELPEGCRFLSDAEAAWFFAQQAGFSFGDNVVLKTQIDLPKGYHYLPEDERNWILARESGFTFGDSVVLTEEIPLPDGCVYAAEDALTEEQKAAGLYVVVSADGGEVPITLGSHMLRNDYGPMLSALVADAIAEELRSAVVVSPIRKNEIDITFGDHMLANGLGDELAALVMDAIPVEQRSMSVVVADNGERLPASFGDYLLNNGHTSLLTWILAQSRGFDFDETLALTQEIALPEGYHYLTGEELWQYAKDSEFAFDTTIMLDAQIELPEGYHYLTGDELNWQLAQEAGFTFGPSVALSEEIKLPKDCVYAKEDALTEEQKAAGLFVIVPKKGDEVPLTLGDHMLSKGHGALLSELVADAIPEELRNASIVAADNGKAIDASFGDHMMANGLADQLTAIVIESLYGDPAQKYIIGADNGGQISNAFGDDLLTNGHAELLVSLCINSVSSDIAATHTIVPVNGGSIPHSFGDYLLENGHGALLDAVVRSKVPSKQQSNKIIVADNGADIPMSFSLFLFDAGATSQLKAAIEAIKTDTVVRFTKACTYDKALYEAEGRFVVKGAVGADFACYLIDNGYLKLFEEVLAKCELPKGVEMPDLPEHYTYDHALYKEKKSLTLQVHDEGANVPLDFAAFLLGNEHGALFYETINPVTDATNLCSLYAYQPEKDIWGNVTGYISDLPTAITYDEKAYTEEGVLNVKLDNPQIPLSFAGTLMSNGLFWETLTDLLGLDNYIHILTKDAYFNQYLIDEVSRMALHTIAILVVSFVIALLLNQEFKGRAFVRAIFFLPVILSSGVLVNLESNNSLMQGVQDLISEQTPFTVTDSMMEILRLTGLGGELLDIVFELIAEVYDIVMASGIQIVVFLSGLQNVPASLYEAADVEGCTKWESFWKITFPLVSPLLIVNLIYTLIDFFSKMGGDLSGHMDKMMTEINYDYMSAMSWVYFLVTLAMIGVSALIVSKVVASDE